jgi:hypothetical protein
MVGSGYSRRQFFAFTAQAGLSLIAACSTGGGGLPSGPPDQFSYIPPQPDLAHGDGPRDLSAPAADLSGCNAQHVDSRCASNPSSGNPYCGSSYSPYFDAYCQARNEGGGSRRRGPRALRAVTLFERLTDRLA